MHVIAIPLGLLIHLWGDLFIYWSLLVVWRGQRAFSPDILSDIPPRPVAAVTLLPIPLLLSVGGGAAVYWGVMGT